MGWENHKQDVRGASFLHPQDDTKLEVLEGADTDDNSVMKKWILHCN